MLGFRQFARLRPGRRADGSVSALSQNKDTAAAGHETLDSLCRYMTDVDGQGLTWRVVDQADGYIEVVIAGWMVVTGGLDETSVLASLVRGANARAGSYLDVPLLRGLDESAFDEELRIRLAAYGY